MSSTICKVFVSSDYSDEHYMGSFKDPITLLSDYNPTFIDLTKEELPIGNTLLCYNNHMLLYWIIRQKIQQYPNLKIILIDAHQEMLNIQLNSCSFLRWLVQEEILNSKNLLLLGIRVFDENLFVHINSIVQITTEEWNKDPITTQQRVFKWLGDNPVYVSVDIDVIDSKFVPGCVDPEPNGVTPDMVENIIWNFSSCNVVGFDLAEVDLSKDHSTGSTRQISESLLNVMFEVLSLK